MKTYLHFDEVHVPGRRTKLWVVRSVQTSAALGAVRWNATRRRYGLDTCDAAFFDDRYLHEVVVFLRRAMTEHCQNPEKAKKARF